MTGAILPVTAALVLRDGKLLISQRLATGANPSLWELPGGKVDFGEHPRAALEREMREELGMQVVVGELYDVFSHVYSEQLQVLLMVYRCQPGPVKPRAIECQDYAFVVIDEALGFDLAPMDKDIIERIVNDPTIA